MCAAAAPPQILICALTQPPTAFPPSRAGCVRTDLTGALVRVASASRCLRHLCVTECLVDVEEVFAALRSCASLRGLAWHGYASDVAVWELLNGGSGLETLSLSPYQESSLSDDAVLAIASYAPQLLHLDLFGACEDRQDGGCGFGDDAIRLLSGEVAGVAGCLKLAQLDIGRHAPRPARGASRLTDASLSLLGGGALPCLTQLGLRGHAEGRNLTAGALHALRTRRPRLALSGVDRAAAAAEGGVGGGYFSDMGFSDEECMEEMEEE